MKLVKCNWGGTKPWVKWLYLLMPRRARMKKAPQGHAGPSAEGGSTPEPAWRQYRGGPGKAKFRAGCSTSMEGLSPAPIPRRGPTQPKEHVGSHCTSTLCFAKCRTAQCLIFFFFLFKGKTKSQTPPIFFLALFTYLTNIKFSKISNLKGTSGAG